MAMGAQNAGKNKGGAYQDRDKPAQIRFSNISAAKGMLGPLSKSKCSCSFLNLVRLQGVAMLPLFLVNHIKSCVFQMYLLKCQLHSNTI